jgi:uncharacterized coiled-coil protein SlyX
VLARLRQDFAVDLDLTALFDNQTIAALATAWSEQQPSQDETGVAQLLDRLEHMTDDEAAALLADTPPSRPHR